ncbi:MAG: hypothetical protein ACXV3F_09825 [Frankiaceae bacterium]
MAIVNVGLLVGTLPLPSLGRVLSLALAGATLALFLPSPDERSVSGSATAGPRPR